MVAVFGALVIALSETYWKTALAVEVYPLHVLMLSIVLNLFVRAVLDTEVAPVKQSKFFFLKMRAKRLRRVSRRRPTR